MPIPRQYVTAVDECVENPDGTGKEVIQHSNWHEHGCLCGITLHRARTTKRLERAWRITMLQQEIDEYYAHFRV